MALPRLVLITACLFLITCSLFFLRSESLEHHKTPIRAFSPSPPPTFVDQSTGFNTSIQHFWTELATSLTDAEPQSPEIKINNAINIDSFVGYKPMQVERERLERLIFTDEDEVAMFHSHYLMRTEAKRLASKLPFIGGNTGIVTTANPKYMKIFLVSLRMIRRTGCHLPVEVFVGDWSEYDATLCESVLPSLGARCVVQSTIYDAVKEIKPLDRFQYKIFAILFSSFQNVLFLDSDSFVAQDPTRLFESAPFTTHGLVLWPDFWATTASSHFYHIAGIPETPAFTRQTAETGQLMINKGLHRESLLMMVYYNYYGPSHYYPLLCQGSHGAGDKETFIPAAEVVGLPYYQVRRGIDGLGPVKKGEFHLSSLGQADPIEDFIYLRPFKSHIHETDKWEQKDLQRPKLHENDTTNQVEPAVTGNPRSLFIHALMYKLNPERVVLQDHKFIRGENGEFQRMWGKKEVMVERFGYDVEQRVWSVLREEACTRYTKSGACEGIKEYIKQVFGEQMEEYSG